MTTVAIVQARMRSTRLPHKALMDIGGQTMLARTVRRTARARRVDRVAVATTARPEDQPIVAEATRLDIPCVRGSEDDVLDRYVKAAAELGADVVVRITSDCPLIDPAVIDRVVESFLSATPTVDYASNTLVRTYPRGLDAEVIARGALERAWRESDQPYEREHVTPYLYENPQRFRLLPVVGSGDHSHLRWTVDTIPDLELVREIYARLGPAVDFGYEDVIELLEREPALKRINVEVQQKPLRGSG